MTTYSVFCEEQFIGEYKTYEEAVEVATEDGKLKANFIGCIKHSNKEVFTFAYPTPQGDEVLDFIIYFSISNNLNN